tara:strand:- start:954 stop:2249 length:1296 start_codon:yes stop_codon:yes gene_type:complete
MEILFNNFYKKKEEPFDKVVENFAKRDNELQNIRVNDLVNLFDSISQYWTSDRCKIKNLLNKEGMGFVVPFLKKNNIEKILGQNFHDFDYLDKPKKVEKYNSLLYARPLGVAVHWIAGNVPVLGVISLFQTLLTKNKTIVKVPLSFKNILPEIFNDLNKNNFFKLSERKILKNLTNSLLIIYVEKEDKKNLKIISKVADLRIAWGGKEAVEEIMKLPKKINCRDIVFGPKVSLALVSKEAISTKQKIKEMARHLANDVFPFDQAGCNAPHNLIIERNEKFDILEIVKEIKLVFEKKVKKNKTSINPIDQFNVISKKFIYESKKNNFVISTNFNSSNVFFSKDMGLKIHDPLYSRSVFISQIKDFSILKNNLPKNIQSIGLFASKRKKIEIVKKLAQEGVDRFPDLGKMSLYQNPWDGYLPLQNMVRWVSIN